MADVRIVSISAHKLGAEIDDKHNWKVGYAPTETREPISYLYITETTGEELAAAIEAALDALGDTLVEN